MNSNSKKSVAGALVLILLGITGLFAGGKSLVLLIPTAMLVWYEARPLLRRDRN